MLLIYTSNVCQKNLKPDTCESYNIQVYITGSLDLCNINIILATSVWFNIDIHVYSKDCKTFETGNMSLGTTSDPFCLIMSHIIILEAKLSLNCMSSKRDNEIRQRIGKS